MAIQIVRDYTQCPPDARGAVIAIGNFDGLHRGHQAVIAQARAIADERMAPCAVMTFKPHPRMFFSDAHVPIKLMAFRQKVEALEILGVDLLYVLRFNEPFSRLTAEAFSQQVLFNGLGAKHIVIGDDFIYGYRRGGNRERLEADCAAAGIGFTCVEGVEQDGQRFSSTHIRGLLSTGHAEAAATMLGRPFTIQGRVVHGEKRGRTIGFPTANIGLSRLFVPAHGVYVVEVSARGQDGPWWPGVANIGTRPTVEGSGEWLEVHLLDQERELYGQRLDVRLLHFHRAEQRFKDVAALKQQIAADAEYARDWFMRRKGSDSLRTG